MGLRDCGGLKFARVQMQRVKGLVGVFLEWKQSRTDVGRR